MQATALLTVVELAHAAGVEVESIRSFEEIGLLPKPRRKPGESADQAYGQEHLDRVKYIRRALEIGFTLETIAQLTSATGQLRDCSDVSLIVDRQLADVRRRIADLQRIEANLSGLVLACPRSGPLLACPIMNALRERTPPDGLTTISSAQFTGSPDVQNKILAVLVREVSDLLELQSGQRAARLRQFRRAYVKRAKELGVNATKAESFASAMDQWRLAMLQMVVTKGGGNSGQA